MVPHLVFPFMATHWKVLLRPGLAYIQYLPFFQIQGICYINQMIIAIFLCRENGRWSDEHRVG